jgi:hypothetical protein
VSESTSDNSLAPSATAIKDALLAGTATFKEIAEALGVTERTVYRMNLPYTIVGGKRRAPLDQARQKIMARVKNGTLPPPRGRGRPRIVRPTTAKEART